MRDTHLLAAHNLRSKGGSSQTLYVRTNRNARVSLFYATHLHSPIKENER
jgi:hypothetical protein